MTLLFISTGVAFTIYAVWLAIILIEHRRTIRRRR